MSGEGGREREREREGGGGGGEECDHYINSSIIVATVDCETIM